MEVLIHVQLIKRTNIDLDHYLLAAKLQTRLSKDVEKREQKILEVVKAYPRKLTQLLGRNTFPCMENV